MDKTKPNFNSRLRDMPTSTLDEFAKNNMMVYNHAMDVEDCKMIVNKFEQIANYNKSSVDAFKTGHKEFTEIDIDKADNLLFWKEPRDKFLHMLKLYKERYMMNLNIKNEHFPPIIDRENIRIKKYLPNDKDEFKEHVDVLRSRGLSAKRFLVFILYLNDVEEGGETHLPKQNIMISPRATRLLVFPPFWTHPHAGLKPISGPKYVMMSYLHYGDKDDKMGPR